MRYTLQKLVGLCATYYTAPTHALKMATLYRVRRVLVHHSTDLMVSVEMKLKQLERYVTDPKERDELRKLGYQFPEDLDNVPRLMSDQGDTP